MIKYSIILPYYKRPELKSSLMSFVYHYLTRNDYEVIVVEDSKNFEDDDDHGALISIIKEFHNKINIRCFTDGIESFSPCKKYNFGFKKAIGEFIVLSSPEVFHESNILDGFDSLLKESRDNYLVCACRARQFDNPVFKDYDEHFNGKMYMWYQHSKMRNVLFHFCSVISKSNYALVGGFDERYCNGIGFDDESFLRRVRLKGIKVIPIDDLVTTHIEHSREYHKENRELIEVNRKLFLQQLASYDFVKNFVGIT